MIATAVQAASRTDSALIARAQPAERPRVTGGPAAMVTAQTVLVQTVPARTALVQIALVQTVAARTVRVLTAVAQNAEAPDVDVRETTGPTRSACGPGADQRLRLAALRSAPRSVALRST